MGMTEKKRFTIVNMGLDGRFIKEDGKIMEIDRVVDLLNENEQLKNFIQHQYDEHKRIVNNYVDKVKEVEKETEQLKQTMKEVAELLSNEVDLFSDKATEHDINAYRELNELDNKDAYYMAKATKTAIKLLKGDVE